MTTWNEMFFQSPSSLMMEAMSLMHNYVCLFLISILIFVMLNIMLTFKLKNFNLEIFEHHQLETIWTLIPFFLLIFLIYPSLTSLYLLDTCLFCGLSVSVMGHQWYWSYFLKDFNNFFFDSYMNPINVSKIRLLEVDNCLLVPSFFPIRFLVSSSDVLHSWAIPSLGVKMDAIPGRINHFCFSSKRSGIFFGQCSEICGANHSFMPIVLEFVSFKDFFSCV